MPVPENLMHNCHVFCYSDDLTEASDKLATYLGCKVSKVYKNQFDPQAQTAQIAWLVGHGSKQNTIVGNDDDTFGYKIRDISDWLLIDGREYTHLVDTCCYPNMRKRYQTFGDHYYCTNDNECVQVITAYPTFDEWWDGSHMHQFE
ncbi:hypothetical protein [Polluticaenibacter yanchengensis]|uniref:Uncharacterized protein n=1 Tax=Polluticaenibacter yanchengensis TaxID=3014562 RepID=A0ABT4UFK7_9BACT|nr:hypothetical protein [Chitinophagaceae bacterium LY-5]